MSFWSSTFGKLKLILTDSPAAGANSVQTDNVHNVAGGGFYLGNAGGNSSAVGITVNAGYARRGVTQIHGGRSDKHAEGDCAAFYGYNFTDGGIAAQSDEGACGITAQVIEYNGWFHGTVSSTTGTGDTAPVLAFTSGNNWTTDGGYLLNISKGQLAGRLTGASSVVSLTTNSGTATTFLNSLPVGTITVTASAYSAVTTYSTGQIVSSGGSNYVSLVNSNLNNTPASSPSQWAVVAANTIPISTAIGVVTAAIANPSTTRDVPVAVSITVNLAQIGGVYKLFTNGSVVDVAGINYPEQSIVSGASGLLAGNQQTFTLHLSNPNTQAIIFQGGIQGQAISADANTMRSAYFAFGSLTGTDMIYGNQVTGGVANNILPNGGCENWSGTGANSAWHLYPRAEVVKNTNQGIACQVEQNGVPWANADNVECARFPTSGGNAAFFVKTQYMPSNSSFGGNGIALLLNGPGISGGNAAAISVNNQQTPSTYSGAGGPLAAWGGITLKGVFGHSIYIGNAPDTAFNSIIFVQSNNTAGGNRVSVINLNWAGGGEISFDVANGRYHIDKMDSGVFSSNGTPGIGTPFTTVPLAKLTPGGANGSLTVAGGVITGAVNPT